MGYPTSITATARSRAAFGLSGTGGAVVVGSGPSALILTNIPATEIRPIPGTNTPTSVPTFIREALAMDLKELTKEGIAELAKPSNIGKTAAAGMRGMNALGWALLAAAAAEEAKRWWDQRKMAQRSENAGKVTWPDPSTYAPGSYVIQCEGQTAAIGPYPESICGILSSIGPNDPEYVAYTSGSYPEGVFVDGIAYSMYRWNNPPSPIAHVATRHQYYFLEEDWIPADQAPDPYVPNEHWPVINPDFRPVAPPQSVPLAPPMVDPMSQPVRSPVPAPTPVPVPYDLIPHLGPNPSRSPSEQPQRGYDSPPVPDTPPVPEAPPAQPPLRWRPDRRPKKGEKERKLKGAAAAAVGWALTVTEANDFVEGMWDALPWYNRSKDADIGQKYQDLYRHWRTVDAEKGLENFVFNAIEDSIFGLVYGAIDAGHFGPGPKWAHKHAGPESQFEKDLANWVEDNFRPIVEGMIESDFERGTHEQVGDWLKRL